MLKAIKHTVLGQTSISRRQGPQTPTYSRVKSWLKDPSEAKTKHYKYPNQLNMILKQFLLHQTAPQRPAFFNSGDHSFSYIIEMRALKHACSNNKHWTMNTSVSNRLIFSSLDERGVQDMWSRDKWIWRMDNDASNNSTTQDSTVFHKMKNCMYDMIQMIVCVHFLTEKENTW